MILRPDGSVGNMLAAAIPSDVPTTWVHDWLYGADWTLVVASLAAAVVCLAVWIKQDRQDPLATAPVRPNRIREDAVFIAFGVYLTASCLLSFVPGAASGDRTDKPIIGATAMILSSAAQLAGAAACLFVAHTRFEGGAWVFLFGRTLSRQRIAGCALTALLALGLCPLIGELTILLIDVFAPDYAFPEHPTLEALRDGASLRATIALWIGAGVVAPIAEELFFRGLVQTWFVHQLKSRWLAILASSIIFGLVHAGQPHVIPALVALAIILGFAYERTGAVVFPIVIHAAFNLKTLAWQALGAFGG